MVEMIYILNNQSNIISPGCIPCKWPGTSRLITFVARTASVRRWCVCFRVLTLYLCCCDPAVFYSTRIWLLGKVTVFGWRRWRAMRPRITTSPTTQFRERRLQSSQEWAGMHAHSNWWACTHVVRHWVAAHFQHLLDQLFCFQYWNNVRRLRDLCCSIIPWSSIDAGQGTITFSQSSHQPSQPGCHTCVTWPSTCTSDGYTWLHGIKLGREGSWTGVEPACSWACCDHVLWMNVYVCIHVHILNTYMYIHCTASDYLVNVDDAARLTNQG